MIQKDPFIGFRGTDKRGIDWEVSYKLYPDTVPVRHQTYVIKFANGTTKEYSGQHLQGCALGTSKNWGMITSRVSAGEYLNKEYKTLDGHTVKIIRITKSRPSYDRSLVEIEWDSNPDKRCVIDLYKVIGTNGTRGITMDDKYFKGPRDFSRSEILTNDISRGVKHSAYCKLPEGIDVYYAIDGTLKRHQHMLDRCYNPNSRDYKNYGAKGVTVSDEWMNIYNFAVWLDKYYIDGWEVDKDLLSQKSVDKSYGPNTCVMIPGDLNITLRSTPNDIMSDLPLCVNHSRNTGGKKYIIYPEVLKIRFSSKFDNLIEAFVHVKIVKEFTANAQLNIMLDNAISDGASIDPEYMTKVIDAMANYEVLDMRDENAPNYITREDIINHMAVVAGWIEDGQIIHDQDQISYRKLKEEYINHKPDLKEWLNKINELIDAEYGEE